MFFTSSTTPTPTTLISSSSNLIMTNTINDNDVYILATGRTPMGGLLGSLSSLSALDLGKHVIQGTLNRTNIQPNEINELYFGNVIAAGNGQNLARQVCIQAQLPNTIPCTTVNKVCASGMKAITLAANSIRCGDNDVVIAGGTESMSNAPHLLPKLRSGIKYGTGECIDAIMKDGLTDAFTHSPMGIAAESTNTKYNITREQQDDYTITSYNRAILATKSNWYKEIIPVSVPNQRRGQPPQVITTDDEINNYNPDKIRSLRPVFDQSGSVTAANASPISDGAAVVILISGKKLISLIKQGRVINTASIYKLISYADAEQEPMEFTTTPTKALQLALNKANLSVSNLDAVELNEAFACVAIANQMLLPGLDADKINIFGGAVALGHPLGASGARIITTLTSVLDHRGGHYGAAAICNGGGGATACIIERITIADIPTTHL